MDFCGRWDIENVSRIASFGNLDMGRYYKNWCIGIQVFVKYFFGHREFEIPLRIREV